jgi:uncharacterized glyoxalase superfamily protein PhnB
LVSVRASGTAADTASSASMARRFISARSLTSMRETAVRRRHTLFVEDADALAQNWLAAGADVRLPQDTEWGQHEGVLIDPDGNVIRFGSPTNAD